MSEKEITLINAEGEELVTTPEEVTDYLMGDDDDPDARAMMLDFFGG